MFDRLPIRWRITLWYTGLLTVALIGFGLTLFFALQYRLHKSFDDQLRAQAALTRANVQIVAGLPRLDPGAVDPGAVDPDEASYFFRLLGLDGRTIADSGPPLGQQPLGAEVFAAGLGGETRITSLRYDGDTVRVSTAPIQDRGATIGVLQVGLSREETDEVLGELLVALGVAAPLVLVVASGGGYLLARRALRPVASITDLAARIGGADLHARLGLTLPDDELGRLAATFDAMLARIEEAFQRQRQFTGAAAHELRTPLSLMRGQVDLALARPRSVAEYQAALRDLDEDLARMTGLVGTLLALARADTNTLALERVPVALADTVAVVVEQYAASAAAAGVSLRESASAVTIPGDEDLMVQVLVNLLDNALVHTPAGGTITVGCAPEPGTAWARLWVEDTGAVIAPIHHERVFDRFYRVDAGRARAHGGVGLGLSFCQAIVAAHGGTISLTSEIGQGTSVQARFPLATFSRAWPHHDALHPDDGVGISMIPNAKTVGTTNVEVR